MSKRKSGGDESTGGTAVAEPGTGDVASEAPKKKRTVRYWLCKGDYSTGAFQVLKEFKSSRGAQGFAEGIKFLPGFDKGDLFALRGKIVELD